jgi:hypothetical protein
MATVQIDFPGSLVPLTLVVGSDDFVGGSEAVGVGVPNAGSTGDQYPQGTLWADTDSNDLWVNYGTEANPIWSTETGPEGPEGPQGPQGPQGPHFDSRLNLGPGASQVSPLTFVQGVAQDLPWVVNASADTDVTLNGDGKTIEFNTTATYLVRLRWGMSTVVNGTTTILTLCNFSGGAVAGGDSIQSSLYSAAGANPDPVQVWVWRVNAGATLVLRGQLGGGSGNETVYDITCDIVRIS